MHSSDSQFCQNNLNVHPNLILEIYVFLKFTIALSSCLSFHFYVLVTVKMYVYTYV
jgi:hypothetical protein